MSKKIIKSIFEGIITEVYNQTCPKKCKELISNKIQESGIKPTDKNTILTNLESLSSLVAIQRYATNSMFQYEGLGLK